MYVCVCVCVCVFVYVCVCLCVCLCVYVCEIVVHIRVCCVCMHVCVVYESVSEKEGLIINEPFTRNKWVITDRTSPLYTPNEQCASSKAKYV